MLAFRGCRVRVYACFVFLVVSVPDKPDRLTRAACMEYGRPSLEQQETTGDAQAILGLGFRGFRGLGFRGLRSLGV